MVQRKLRAKMIVPVGQDVSYPIEAFQNDATTVRDLTGIEVRLRYRKATDPDTFLGTWTNAVHDDETNGVTHIDIVGTAVPTIGTYEYILDESPYGEGSYYEIGDFIVIDAG